ncbi:NAD-aldehyde dehydrogenase [Roridomyces roridus]|uniref:Aldehyde dehydrogenase n=1 Tax=Roridomyces roridus TaxID=1738132 RepID=A0AAD7BX99_9AGAR|nr:NAD-aldehyde dehydrogenase [Roridomyces roridus]
MALAYTPLDDITKIHAELKAGFQTGKTKSLAYRKYQLLQLGYLIKDNAKRFEEALAQDLGRHAFESYFLEVNASLSEILECYKSVDAWAKPDKPAFNVNFVFMKPTTYKVPKGVVLVISPFNYPMWLIATPLAGAIAAGNAVVIKPSESCPATAALWTELLPKYLDSSLISIVNGAIPETTRLLELPWGHVLYTGSGRVGRIVARAAANTLTPVSLELGGKSPVFIDPDCDFKFAAKRLLWGKFTNAGQTCVAPDYVFVTKGSQDAFIEALKLTYESFYPETTGPSPKPPQNVTKMVNAQAFTRVNGLLQNSKGTVVCGGQTDEVQRFIAPTIVRDVKLDDSLMSEEIFGPLLPIVPVDNLDEAIAYVNAHDHPLALYVFTQNEVFKKKVFENTLSGSAVANETIIIPGVPGLPFGGIGASGSGYHTGKYGFDMFTHFRASMDTPGWIDKILGFRFPPYTDQSVATLRSRMPIKLPARPAGPPTGATSTTQRKWFLLAFALAIVGALTRMKNLQLKN